MLANVGLLVIFIGWMFQLGRLRKGGRLSLSFVGLYIAGVLLIVIDGFEAGAGTTTYLNILTFVGAAMVLHTATKK